MTRSWDKFALLFKKNWLLQRRHRSQTIVEIIVPVVFSALLVLIRSLVDIDVIETPTTYEPFSPYHYPTQNLTCPYPGNDTIIDVIPYQDLICKFLLTGEFPLSPGGDVRDIDVCGARGLLKDFYVHEWAVFYSPNTSEVKDFMETVKSYSPFVACGVEDSATLEYELNRPRSYLRGLTLMGVVLAGLAFPDNIVQNGIPLSMDVAIRFPGERRVTSADEQEDQQAQGNAYPLNWYTNLVFPLFQTPGPRNKDEFDGGSPGYYKEGFLTLQSAVSSAFVQLHDKDSKVPPYNVSLQRFPFPPYVDDVLLQAMESFVPTIIMLSFVYTAISLVRTVTTEKERQLKEAMKMMGLPNWLHWCAWFTKSLIFFFISIALITILVMSPIAGPEKYVFSYSDWSCVLAFLFVFIMASITFCFAVSTFFSKANIAAIVSGLLWFLSYFPYVFLQQNYSSTDLGTKLSVSLLSNSAMAYGFQIILMFEGTGQGLQWSNLWTPVTPQDTLTMGHIMGMLLADCIIYMIIAIYIEAVFPGDYGVPHPWYFPVTKTYWCGEEVSEDEPPVNDSKTVRGVAEAEPRNLTAGVQIQNLRKVYGNGKTAVEGLTLNMYEGQITVLLGHNGAGKTTTMSMLTGLYTPTSGTAKISGHDIRKDMDGARETLGLCPQHNVLFEELTVKEHLEFFGKLKGLTGKDLKKETKRFIELLELENKADTPASSLSGGMQRKLAAAVALCGGSKVVLFDEPTSGMDPSARRALWDLLQAEKNGRTILLTTHFMDEADVLGDRIAIMSEGQLQCIGSSFFLKKKYGGGYHLVLVKNQGCVPSAVTQELDKFMPGIQPTADIGAELSYHLDDKYLADFEKIFLSLENKQEQLGIQSYGVSLTTMEEVFIKVGSDAEVGKDEDDATEGSMTTITLDKNGNRPDQTSVTMGRVPLLEGFDLLWNQTLAMWFKYILSTYRSWILFVIIVIIPVLNLSIAILVGRNMQGSEDLPTRSFHLDDYKEAVVALSAIGNADSKLVEAYKYLVAQEPSDIRDLNELKVDLNVSNYILNASAYDVGGVSQTWMLGTSFEEDGTIVGMFNNQPYHVPPLALSFIYNAILRAYVSEEASINFVNKPMPFTPQTKAILLQTGGNMGFQIAFNLGFSFSFVVSYFIVFYIRERVAKAKLLQFVSGVNTYTFWFSAYLWNMIVSLGPVLAIVITLAAFQEDGFSSAEELGRAFVAMICCVFASLPITYLASFLFSVPAAGFSRLIMLNVFTGVVAFIIVMVLQTPTLDLVDVANTLDWVFTFLPTYSLTYSFQNLNRNFLIMKACTTYPIDCTNTINVCCREPSQCPNGECLKFTEDYFDFEQPGIGRNIAMFFVTGGVLFILLLVKEFGFLEIINYKLRGSGSAVSAESQPEDSDVQQENYKISQMPSERRKDFNLMMQQVTKYYGKFRAVNNLNLGVKEGECFGLLGVNGAGKTTSFKMLTGDVRISSGDAFVQGLSIKNEMKQVRQLIGYCPQFDAVLDDLTGRELLRLFCLLRGIPNSEVKHLSERLAKELLFSKHIDKQVKAYSGGNKRKLSTAVALIGDPPVVYLDEPTTGMDPVAKRHLWDVICKIRDSGKTIILTSHSMEECEALCTRLAIMVNGEFKCLGSVQHLKNKFAEGYTLTINVKRPEQDILSNRISVNHRSIKSATSSENSRVLSRQNSNMMEIYLVNAKAFVERSFRGAILREEYLGMLTYHIPKTELTWAKMFGIMQRGKEQLNIDDYSLGQTSLEQVFLSFTKYQNAGNEQQTEKKSSCRPLICGCLFNKIC